MRKCVRNVKPIQSIKKLLIRRLSKGQPGQCLSTRVYSARMWPSGPSRLTARSQISGPKSYKNCSRSCLLANPDELIAVCREACLATSPGLPGEMSPLPAESTLAQLIRSGVAFSEAVLAMRRRCLFSILSFPILVPWALALSQTAHSTQPTAWKSKSHPAKPDEGILLARARQGDAVSQMWLGAGYEQGWFRRANLPEALKWFRKSAEQGDPDAQFSLGQMYEDGKGVTQNYALAAKWYRKAAEHNPDLGGAGHGRNNLGMLYLEGRGVPKDYVQAYVWFKLDKFASNPHLPLAMAHMTPEQILEADRSVDEWQVRLNIQ
jgi:tetratricopeptide (TPR) repeat protein